MTNLLALAAHCRRGDELIIGHQNHIFNYEGGGASALLGVAFHPVPTLADGTNRIEDIREGTSRQRQRQRKGQAGLGETRLCMYVP